MKTLIGTIARLSRREFDQAVPSTGSPDELGSMAQALETLRTSALEAERLQLAMNRFTADASHQMRTPLTILRTHISVLGGLIPASHVAYSSLKDIQEAADRLQRLLIQLLKLARADGGQSLGRESGTIDLREVIQEIATKHVPQALEAGIDLHFEAEQRPFPAQANPITINEIFANLIDNAIRYNKAGGSVVIRLFDEKGKHVVDVEDDGPGIPDAEREKVFTRFYRLSRDQSRVGSGLGLAIVRSLAASLNAEISHERRSRQPRSARPRLVHLIRPSSRRALARPAKFATTRARQTLFLLADSFLKAAPAHDEEPDAASGLPGASDVAITITGEQDGNTTPC